MIDFTVFCCLLMMNDFVLFMFFHFKDHPLILILVFLYPAIAFSISFSSLNSSACHSASHFFFINNASICSSATQTFSCIAFSLADSFDDPELEVEFDLKDLDPDDFKLFPEDFDFLSNFSHTFPSFSQLWILCLKAKILSSISLNHISSI